MADYNVQMKQYNGTSFDNILPHAYLADTATELAGGGDATEIIAQARAGLSQIATGSYVGTGTYGYENPTVIVCGFKPKMVLFYSSSYYVRTSEPVNQWGINSSKSIYGCNIIGWFEGVDTMNNAYGSGSYMYYTQTDSGLSFYASGDRVNATEQNNVSGLTYSWLAIA